jgi:cysteine desulfurase/selenocysteine lyase
VLDAMRDYYETTNSNIGRGYYRLAFAATDAYEHSRGVVQRALNAEHVDEIVFTPGTTAALNLLADTFGRSVVRAGDRVLVSGMEHNSNLLPWRRLCESVGARLVTLGVGPTGRLEPAELAAALDDRVRLLAVTHVSNVLGTVNPVRELVAVAHAHGVPVIVDGAQAVPHWPVDVSELGADFYVFSGHKVYGPMGIGVLYGRRERLLDLSPYQVGGGTVKGISSVEPVRYVPVPARLEAGTPNVAAAVGLAAALEYLEKLGWDNVRRHNDTLVRRAVELLGAVPGVTVLGDPLAEPAGIVSISVPGIHPYDVGGHLGEFGVAVRSGVQCANLFLDSLGLVGAVRLSFAVYNDEEELLVVRDALRTVEPGFWTREHPTERFL